MSRIRVLCISILLLIAASRPARAQNDPTEYLLKDADAAILARYLPVIIRRYEEGKAEYRKSIEESDRVPAWRDSVMAGRVDIAGQLDRLYGPLPLPPDVVLDVPCTAKFSPVGGYVDFHYLLKERLPPPTKPKDGLAALGGAIQAAAGLGQRNGPVIQRWGKYLEANGYKITPRGFDEYHTRIVRGDTLWVYLGNLSLCGDDENDARYTEPMISFNVPYRDLSLGRRAPTADTGDEFGRMLASDGLSEDHLMAVIGAAGIARMDAESDDITGGLDGTTLTPETRALFERRRANAAWYRKQGAGLGDLLLQWERAVR